MGSTHDSTASNNTLLSNILGDKTHPLSTTLVVVDGVPQKLWMAGDDAYKGNARTMHNNLITPFGGKKVDDAHDAFNFYQSSCRISIECTFGEVIALWGILWHKLKT